MELPGNAWWAAPLNRRWNARRLRTCMIRPQSPSGKARRPLSASAAFGAGPRSDDVPLGHVSPPVATMDEAKERQQTGPRAAPFVHRIRMMRSIVKQAPIERADAIGTVLDRAWGKAEAKGEVSVVQRFAEFHR
jgi:hypothetical protein